MNNPLHVEVVLKRESQASRANIILATEGFLSNFVFLSPGTTISQKNLEKHPLLCENVESIILCDIEHDQDVLTTSTELLYHVYKLNTFGAETDTMTDSNSGEQFAVADVWALPAQEFHGLWESLVYDCRLKADTVRFVETAFEFAERSIDPNIVGWNRVVLFHGPPGTGKTSMCRALAQKISIRFAERFPRARLIEINAHGLFSKWFAESGKQVARLFDRVHEMVEDRRLLVCVLVDEVESLAHARRAALTGLEPSDSIRAVNALLTQMDRLRRHPNVLVLTTSNVTGAIDVAFADRADIKRLIGPPSARAAYEILRSCCVELMARGAVKPIASLFTLPVLNSCKSSESSSLAKDSLSLWEVAQSAAASRLSGRALRRLPFLARARDVAPPTLPAFVAALLAALHDHMRDDAHFREQPVADLNGH